MDTLLEELDIFFHNWIHPDNLAFEVDMLLWRLGLSGVFNPYYVTYLLYAAAILVPWTAAAVVTVRRKRQ